MGKTEKTIKQLNDNIEMLTKQIQVLNNKIESNKQKSTCGFLREK